MCHKSHQNIKYVRKMKIYEFPSSISKWKIFDPPPHNLHRNATLEDACLIVSIAKNEIIWTFVYFVKWGAQTSSNRNKMYCNFIVTCMGYTIVENYISLSWTGKEIRWIAAVEFDQKLGHFHAFSRSIPRGTCHHRI